MHWKLVMRVKLVNALTNRQEFFSLFLYNLVIFKMVYAIDFPHLLFILLCY